MRVTICSKLTDWNSRMLPRKKRRDSEQPWWMRRDDHVDHSPVPIDNWRAEDVVQKVLRALRARRLERDAAVVGVRLAYLSGKESHEHE